MFYMVRLEGLEPQTYGLEGQCFLIHGKQREQIAACKTAGYMLALFPVAS